VLARQVLFTELSKWDGSGRKELCEMDVRQIAGRAGRFGTKYPNGQALVIGKQSDAAELARRFHAPVVPIKRAGLFPSDKSLIESAEVRARAHTHTHTHTRHTHTHTLTHTHHTGSTCVTWVRPSIQ
jgi:hypothetical protein